ncbi:MAG: hypothetical protein HZY73_12335 [Micropruina sp.]|nr:MAG: hypothetical protein HZY73_12335 [Micropruina sp.]
MDETQPLRPHTLWQRLCARFHREPVTRIPHADTARPEDLPAFDLEAAWSRIEAIIDDVAFGRSVGAAYTNAQGNARIALDSAHGDLVDRYIVPIIGAYKADLDQAQRWRLENNRLHLLQRVQHLTERSLRADTLRSNLRNCYAERDEAWTALGGTTPAQPVAVANPAQPITARPLPTIPTTESTREDTEAAAPVTTLPPHTVPRAADDKAAEWDSGSDNGEEAAA